MNEFSLTKDSNISLFRYTISLNFVTILNKS